MAIPAIVQDGAPVLRAKAKVVPQKLFGTAEFDALVADMAAALDREHDGVAIAAPQIAVPYRLFLVRYDRMLPTPPEGEPLPPPAIGIYANPQILKTSRKLVPMDEGCLSVRGYYGAVRRHERATVRAQDERGAWFTRGAGGLLAQAFQHETDHLDGTLFIDKAEEVRKVPERKEAKAEDKAEKPKHG